MGSEYVRNDTANNIADGNVISAADFDGEFEKLVTAFTAGTGHSHDGTTGEGGFVTKLLGTAITIGDGTAGTDIAVTFDGETNDGTLTWMEDEARFDFANKVKIVDATDVDVSDTTVGSLVLAGGAVITKDLLVGDDIFLDSDSSVIKFGADQDITLTHAADTSLTLGGAGGTTGLIINNTATDGDPFLAFALSGTQTFTMGVEDGDSDKFKIGTSAIGTSTILTLTGDDMILADDLSLQSDGAILNFGANDDISVTHTADTSLTVGGAGGTTGVIINNTASDGDPFLAFALSGTQTFTMGVDDGDSDKFKIGTTAIGTNTRFTIDSSGNSEFSGAVTAGGAITAGGDVTAKTGDGAILALQTSLDTVINGSVLGTIQFTAPEEASDTDSRELAAEIAAVAEEAFSTTSNATELVFKTGASEAATSKMVLSSTGILSVNGGVIPTSADGAALGSATKEWSDLYLADSGVIYFGNDQDTFLTHVADTGLRLNSTRQLQFHDADTFITSSTDGQLDIDADTELELTAPTVDIAASTAVTIATPSLIITDNTTDEPIVQIKNTHNGTTAGELRFVMDKGAAGADGDDLGTISFYGDDAGQNQTAFAKIVGEVSEADQTDEAGKLSFFVAESDGTNTALTAGLVLEGEHATDGEVDVTIGAGIASTTSVAGVLNVAGGAVFNEDSADVDFRVESNGKENMFFVDGGNDSVIIGHNAKITAVGSLDANLQLVSGDAQPSLDIICFSDNANHRGQVTFSKSASDTIGTGAVLGTSDLIGDIVWGAHDGTDFQNEVAFIRGAIDSAGVGANDTGGMIQFGTTTDGNNSASERMRITGSGNVLIGGTDATFATADADNLVIGSTTGSHGLAIVSNATNGYSSIHFSDANSGDGRLAGYIDYSHQYNEMTFGGGGAGDTRMKIRSGGVATFGQDDFIKTDGFLKVSNTFAFHGSTDNYANVAGQNFHELNSGTGNEFILMLKNTNSGTNQHGLYIDHASGDTDNTSARFIQGVNTANRFQVLGDGDVQNHDNSYGAISDERIKQDIVDANSQWNDIKSIKVRNYKKKDDVREYGDKAWSQIGVIAQELETTSPYLIKENTPSKNDILSSSEFGTLYTSDDAETKAVLYEDGDTIPEGSKVGDVKTPASKVVGDIKEEKTTVKSVKYSVLYMKAIKALQEAMTRIETLETKVKALEDA